MHLTAKGIVHPHCDEEEPVGMLTRTFCCTACFTPAKLTVHADSPEDPRVMDRFRLLASSLGWVIDFVGQPWCGEHRPDKQNKPKRQRGKPPVPEGEPERKDLPSAPERMVPRKPTRPARPVKSVRSVKARPQVRELRTVPRPEVERSGHCVCRKCWTIHPPEMQCR
jgi:hypothetical protein